MIEIIQNPNIDSLLGFLIPPNISIAFGDISDSNTLGITCVEKFLNLMSQNNHFNKIKLALVENSDTEDLFNLIADDIYIDSLQDSLSYSILGVYNFINSDLIVWAETNDFFVGDNYIEHNIEFEKFITISNSSFKKEDLTNNDFIIKNNLQNHPEIISCLLNLHIYNQ